MQKYCHAQSQGFTASSKIYVKGFPGAAELRNQLMSTKSTDEVRALLDKFEDSVGVAQDSETV